MIGKDKVRTPVTLSIELKKRVETFAKDNGTSVNATIVSAIEEFLTPADLSTRTPPREETPRKDIGMAKDILKEIDLSRKGGR